MNTSAPEPNFMGPDQKKPGTQVTLNLTTLGISVCGCVALCVMTWILSQDSQESSRGAESPIFQDSHAGKATHDYWTSIGELDNKSHEEILAIFAEIERATNKSELEVLCDVARGFSTVTRNYMSQVARLPLKDVDQVLLSYLRIDFQLMIESVNCLEGMAESGVALQEWAQRTQPPEKFWTDLLESFMGGLMGRPFAGYEKAQREAAELDAEGQSLLNAYWQHNQNLSKCLKVADEMKIDELKVRSCLSEKYGMEFPPRPDPAELLQ